VSEVRSGDVLAALILPADLVERINSLSTPSPTTPKVEVIVNEEDPVKARLVNDRINSLLTQANLTIARKIAGEGGKFLNLVLDGGSFSVLGQSIQILGLRNTARILTALRPALAPGPLRASLDQVLQFTTLTRANLGTAAPLLTRLTQPIAVDKEVVNASTPPLEVFAIAVAATFTLAFVTVLLVAGSLALEREENAFPRLTRGLVSRSALLTEKVALGVAVGLVVTVLMLAGLSLFVPLHWSRFGLWLAAIVIGGAALGAAGAALGAVAREVRAVSLLAFMVTLPVAFLSLIPSGTVGPALYNAIKLITALFPFKPALQAMTGALDPAGPSIAAALLHLAILIVAYGLLARFALRRFATV
jgi:ABC-2 type transport system permease protein